MDSRCVVPRCARESRGLRSLSLYLLVVAAWATPTAGRAQDLTRNPEPLASKGLLTSEDLVAAVLERNPGLEAQRAAVEAARARIRTAGALDDPMLSVGLAPNTIGNNATGTRGSVEVSQSFPWWGTLDARTAEAKASTDAATQEEQSQALRLRALAQGAFAEWHYIHVALEVNRHHQALYTELREAARARLAAGLAPEQNVLQADVERAMLRQEAIELTQQQRTVQANINTLLNRPGDEALAPPGALPIETALPPLAALKAFALEAHPSVRELDFQERAASEQITLAQKASYPNFQVSTGYNSMWDNTAQRPMLGVSINVPLDQSKRRAELDAARASLRRLERSRADLDAQLDGEMTAAYSAVETTRESLALYRDQLVPLAASTLAVSRSEYAVGRSDFLAVISAERRALDADLGLARMEAEVFKRLAELGRLAGTSLPIEIPRGRDFDATAPRGASQN
jgi:outer membrane protein, heavy metal efflux system